MKRADLLGTIVVLVIAVGAFAAAGDATTPPPTVAKLQAQLAADDKRIAELTAVNTAVVRGLHACQAQRNTAMDAAINDAMGAP